MPTWEAPVRYAEVDQQGVVFNAHYLTYCDEAMGAFCVELGLREFAARVMLVTSALTWSGSARWGDTVHVDAVSARLGTSSVQMTFDVSTGRGRCCRVETTYVYVGDGDRPLPLPAEVRAALTTEAGAYLAE
jgi:acyl-CoA thioester hydrolase